MEIAKDILIMIIGGYKVVLLVSIFSSWIPKVQKNRFVIFLNKLANVSCDPIRRILKSKVIDLSPLIVYMTLSFIQSKLMTLSFTGF